MIRHEGEVYERRRGSLLYWYRKGDEADNGFTDFVDPKTGIRFKSFLENDIEKMVELRKDLKNPRKRKGFSNMLQKKLKELNSEANYFLLYDNENVVGLVVLNNKEEMHFFSYYNSNIPGFYYGVNRCMITLKNVLEMTGAENGKVFLFNAA